VYGIGLSGNRGFRDGGSVSAEPTAYDELIGVYASQYGLDPMLFRNLIRQESGFNPVAVSTRGAQGLGQVMPATAQDPGYGVQPLAAEDLMDPAENLRFSAEYLSAMMREFDGDERLAVAAYNAGPGAVREYGGVPPFEETQNYVRNILGSPGSRPEQAVRPVPRPDREDQAESKSPMDSLSSALAYMDLAGVGQAPAAPRVQAPGILRPRGNQRRDPLKQLGIASLA